MTTSERKAHSAAFVRDVCVAALILAASALLKIAAPEHISPEHARRTIGVIFGAMVTFYANQVPKALVPYARLHDPAADQSLRRYTGWTLAMGGVAYALTWMAAPLAIANVFAACCLFAAVLLVVGRFARDWRLARRA